jgi:phosphate transport system permease protein
MSTAFAEHDVQTPAAVDTPTHRAPAPLTQLPSRAGRPASIATKRKIGGVTRDDLLLIGGAAVSSLATTTLLFGRITPITGQPGFLVVAFVIFILVYAVLVSLTETRPVVVDRVMAVLLTAAASIAMVALATVIIYTFVKGWKALVHSNFYTQDLSRTGPSEPLTTGGVTHAMVGTLIMTLIALVITVPLGIACAVFITETRGRLASFVRTVVTAMTALPSILAGLFIFATLILALGFERSGFAASIAVSIMMLPIIVRSADVVLRLVPGGLREASAALGAPHWRTVWGVVLPTARSGLTTSVILGVARGVGETAPVLLTAGFTGTMNTSPLHGPMVSLPLTSYYLVASGQTNQIIRGFATASVLMVLVLVLFTLARVIGGKPAGRLSKRQSKAAAAQSLRDLQRIEARKGEVLA